MNRIILIFVAVFLFIAYAFAQTGTDEEFADAPPPPEIPVPIESGEPIEPEITIIRDQDKLVEEYRINGQLYMIKITPKIGKPYYLVDRDGDGRMEARLSEIYDDFVVPQWVIFSW